MNLPIKGAPSWSSEPITEKGGEERDFMVLNIPFSKHEKKRPYLKWIKTFFPFQQEVEML
jgi:hypothetical protein